MRWDTYAYVAALLQVGSVEERVTHMMPYPNPTPPDPATWTRLQRTSNAGVDGLHDPKESAQLALATHPVSVLVVVRSCGRTQTNYRENRDQCLRFQLA